ncbi:hypothetical protein QVD17_38177 [Tagetes erecta]|uniref:Zinc finger GRF-type domain-containing protein n=1 Tax=Tagetes erecta TaxID=13708 RepID=A0AAD8JY61_TARER|nr:hypothetical protein QVD17_38177 [Tagetes erecta]
MSSSSSSSILPFKKLKSFRLGTDGNVYCNHNMVAVLRVAGSRSFRHGHEFYGCPLWPESDSKFFIWKEYVDVMLVKDPTLNNKK